MKVAKIKKITIVDIDAVGTYVLSLSGQLARSSIANVDVLYIKEGADWKIESVIER